MEKEWSGQWTRGGEEGENGKRGGMETVVGMKILSQKKKKKKENQDTV